MSIAYLLVALQAAPAAATPAPADPKICRYETATGSIFPGRICKPRSEWVKTDAKHDRDMDSRSNNNTIDRSQGGNAAAGADSFGQSNR